MNLVRSVRLKVVLLCFALCGFCQGQNIGDLNQQALQAMKAGEWERAHQVLVTATDKFDGQALQLFGPRFGWFWYHRGYCELKLKKYDDAMISFKTCNHKFRNVPPKPNQVPVNNFYEKKALLMWGHAAKGAEEWAASIRIYKKFLDERDPDRDRYEEGVFQINMAINHYKLKKVAEGNHHLEIAIKGKATFPTSNKGIMAAFSELAAYAIENDDEASLLASLQKNHAHYKLQPFESHHFSRLIINLSQAAREAGMIQSAFELYALMPDTLSAIDDTRARLATLATYDRTIRDGSMIVKRAKLEEDLAKLENSKASGKMDEIYAYLAIARMHEEAGNVRGAFAVYEQLELYFPDAQVIRAGRYSPIRESDLEELVRTSYEVENFSATAHYGSVFLKTFGNNRKVAEVRRKTAMSLLQLFYEGDYEDCLKIGKLMRPELRPPSKLHAACLITLGGSHHYLGKFTEAQPQLDEYLSTYAHQKDEQSRVQAARYFQAANRSRLHQWTESMKLLDEFLTRYPNRETNVYFPYALYDLEVDPGIRAKS